MGRPAVLKIDILADAKGVGKGVADADSKLSRLGAGAKRVGLAVGVGLAAGAVAVGAFAVSSVKAASDVEQSFGAVESVFGKNAAQVKAWATGAASSVGLAKSEYASLASTVGSQLQGMGQSQAEAARTTNDLIGMGADLAATFGGSVSDAVGAVGSLLRGERDPIEKYGVAISAADVQARLAAQGQDKLTGAALKTAQANATLTLLTEKTKNAHGAFGRESDTLAGQQERLRAQFENVKATVGAGLTPILTKLLTFVTTTAIPKAQAFAQTLQRELGPAFEKVGAFIKNPVLPTLSQLSTFVQNNQTAFKALAAGVAVVGAGLLIYKATVGTVTAVTKVWAAGQLILNAVLTANPIGLVVVAIAALAAGIVIAYKKSETFRTVVQGAFSVVKTYANTVKAAIEGIVRVVKKAIDMVGKLAGAAKKVKDLGGKLNPFGGPQLVGAVGALTTPPSYALRPRSMVTAAAGDPSLALLTRGLPTGGAALVYVDRRNIDARVSVNGALDPPSVARQLEQLLRDQAIRLGRVPTFGGTAA